MVEKIKAVIDFLSGYPTWVVIVFAVLVIAAASLLIIFRPKQNLLPKSEESAQSTLQKLGEATAGVEQEKSSSAKPNEVKPIKERNLPPSPKTDEASGASVNGNILVVTSRFFKDRNISAFRTITKVWPGVVSHLVNVTRESFVSDLAKGYSIIHIEAVVQSDYVEFDDGIISAAQLENLFSVHSKNVKLVVLSACQSFRVGKALESSGIGASLVATSNLYVSNAEAFYDIFYRQLASGRSLRTAYYRAASETGARFNFNARETFLLSEYTSSPSAQAKK